MPYLSLPILQHEILHNEVQFKIKTMFHYYPKLGGSCSRLRDRNRSSRPARQLLEGTRRDAGEEEEQNDEVPV